MQKRFGTKLAIHRKFSAILGREQPIMLPLADNALTGSCDEIEHMTDVELLEAIWSYEATYKKRKKGQRERDHRRYLERIELETIFHLARRRAQLKTAAMKIV